MLEELVKERFDKIKEVNEIKQNELSVCYYQVTYALQSEFTLYSRLKCQGPPCSKQAQYLIFK